MEPLAKPAIAEGLGAFALTFIGAGAVVFAGNDIGGGLVGVALAHGLVIMVMVVAFGAVSGGHFNPAVTIGMWLNGKVDSAKAGVYIAAQLTGAVLGALVLKFTIPTAVADAANLGTPKVGHVFGAGSAQAVLGETVLTFFLVLTIFAVATDDTNPFSGLAPLAIGGVLIACILAGGPLSGAALNPARWLGPALVSGSFTDWWVYLVGPIMGGIVAAMLWGLLLDPKRNKPPQPWSKR